MESYTDDHGHTHPERRQHPRLRAIFDDARERVDRFFHATEDWVGSSIEHLALRLVHEAYPDLSSQEVRILLTAIERRLRPMPA